MQACFELRDGACVDEGKILQPADQQPFFSRYSRALKTFKVGNLAPSRRRGERRFAEGSIRCFPYVTIRLRLTDKTRTTPVGITDIQTGLNQAEHILPR
jgi:hypothetical protein